MPKIPTSLRWKNKGSIGQGAQASVYEVEDSTGELDGTFALKALGTASSNKARTRFANEITSINKCSHPSIVRILDHSSPEDAFQYYVMEKFEGAQSLQKLIRNKCNPFYADALGTVNLFRDIMDALDECGQKGIVHRDLSPANLLILPDRSIRLIDFGICHFEDGERVTLLDEGVGSRNYTAPECESGSSDQPTIAADIYSAGKLAWTAITDLMAFAREKDAFGSSSMQKIFKEKPETWHLSWLFENTIRHDPENRWNHPSQAIAWADSIYRLIAQGFFPIEIVINHCHACGIGSLLPYEKSEANGLFMMPLPHFLTKRCCDYCGLITLRDTSIATDVYNIRKSIE